MQEDVIGYDSNGVGRIVVLAFMGLASVISVLGLFASTMLPEHVARPLDAYSDVLRAC